MAEFLIWGGAEEKRPLLCGALPQPKVVFYMQSARVSLISLCGVSQSSLVTTLA